MNDETPKAPPQLHSEKSAPARIEHKSLLHQRSSDKMKAKRESMEKHRHECAESGDDEDEVLGDVAVRVKTSPKSNASKERHRGSKLGTEMMRTNSRGSVVSGTEVLSSDSIEPPPTVTEEQASASGASGDTSTPPEVYDVSSLDVSKIDLNETPKPSESQSSFLDEEPTPRAPLTVSNSGDDYLGAADKDGR
jgi:serine/threonine-protein kinase RIM15